MIINDCLPALQLKELIEDDLSEADRESLDSHLATCAECQQQLDAVLLDDSISLWRRSAKARETIFPDAASLSALWKLTPAMDSSLSDAFSTSAAKAAAVPRYVSVPDWIGDYEIHEEIGRGGMSVVFRATRRILGRTVALKRLNANCLAPEDLERFHREARASARMHHPNIVQVFEVGTEHGYPYLALEYVAGGNLAAFLKGSPLDADSTAEFLEKVSRAVQHAHTHGIIHRDLKPANILLQVKEPGRSRSLGEFEPKIADFGLARLSETTLALTNPDVLAGTPAYLAPELIREGNRTPTAGVDVYSLGVIMYEMLIGRPPLIGPNALATVRLVDSTEPVPPRRLQPQLPRDLETICLKCLSKDPARRYPSALALADDLQRFRENRPIEARRVSRFTTARMWCRRNPLPSALSFVSLAILFVGLAGIVWQWRAAVAAKRDLQTSLVAEAEQRRKSDQNVYASAIAQAAMFWENGDVYQARELLASAVPTAGQEDFRGWEWLYLNELFHSERAVIQCEHWVNAITRLPGTNDSFAVAIGRPRMHSSDVLTPKDGRAAVLFLNNATPTLIDGPIPPSGVKAVAISRDGGTIAWGGATGEIVLWNAFTRQNLRTISTGTDLITVGFASNDSELVVGNSSGKVNCHDVATGERKREYAVLDADCQSVICTDPRDRCVAIAGGHNRLPVFQLPDFSERADIAPNPIPETITAGAFDAGGGLIAMGTSNGVVILWNRQTQSEVVRISAHSGPVYCVAFAAKGNDIATAGTDCVIRIWDRTTGKLRMIFRGHSETIRSLCYSADEATLVSGGQDGTLRVWNARHDPRGTRLEFDDRLNSVAVNGSSGELEIRAASLLGSVKTWRGQLQEATDQLTLRFREGRSYPVRYTAFLNDGGWVAAIPAEQSTCAAVWDSKSGAEVFRTPASSGVISTLATDIDQKRLGWATQVGENESEIHWCEPGTANAVGKIRIPSPKIRALAIDRAGLSIAAIGRSPDNVFALWLISTDMRTPPISIPILENSYGGIAFSPDGQRVAVGAHGLIEIFQTGNGERLRSISFAGNPTDIAWSPDGRRIVSVGYTGVVTFMIAETGKVLFQLRGLSTDRPHDAASNARVAFSADGRTLISTNWDGSLNVWNSRR